MDMTPIKTLAGVTSLFENAARDFLTKGYFYTPDAYDYNSGKVDRDPVIPYMTLSKFVRRVAKEQKRPMITAWTKYRHGIIGSTFGQHPFGIGIEIPKRKFTAPLIHCLKQAGFNGREQVTLWNFHINDDEFAKEYLSFFETRPEFRKACRLPPLTA